MLLLLLAVGCGRTGPPTTDGPFVEAGPGGEVAVVWSTAEPGASRVDYGLTDGLGLTAEVSGTRSDHRVPLSGLLDGRVYHYRVSADHDGSTFLTGVTFVRGPYLQNPTDSTVTVMWRVNAPAAGTVHAGGRTFRETEPGRALVSGLPGEDIGYRVTVDGVSSPAGTIPGRTADSLRLAFFGDSRGNPPVVRALSDRMLARDPDVVLHSGDFVYDGRNEAEWDPEFFEPAAVLLRSVPVLPAIGNHEHDHRSYYDAFEVPVADPVRPEAWYSVDLGLVHLTVLDTNPVSGLLAAGTAQRRWLEADLAAAEAPWTVVMFHHPLYSSGRHGSNEVLRDRLAPLFESSKVDLLVAGHDHCYERTWPMRDGRRDPTGVVHVVSGGGGAVLYPVGRSGWTAVSESDYHYGVIRATRDRLDADVLDAGDREIDAFSLMKRDEVARIVGTVEDAGTPRAIRDLGRLGHAEHAPLVARHAGSPDVVVRRATAEALSRISDVGSAAALSTLSRDADDEVRRWATRGLAYLPGGHGVGALVARLADADAETRRYGAVGLRLSPDPGGLPGLVDASGDPDPRVRQAAVKALRYYPDRAARTAVVAAVGDPAAEVKHIAVSTLVEIGQVDGAVQALADILPSEPEAEKLRILELLGTFGDPAAVAAVVRELKTGTTPVRRRAAIELASLRSVDAVPALIDALGDEDRGVRQFSWRALRVITGERHPQDADAWRAWYARQGGR